MWPSLRYLAGRLRSLCGAFAVAVVAVSVAGCIGSVEPAMGPRSPDAATIRLAVLPVENLSGRTAPLADLRRMLIDRLLQEGFTVLDDEALERVLTKHRVRYTAGLDRSFARIVKQEAGVEGVVFPALEQYDAGTPPRVAMFARLVSAGDAPAVIWIDGTGLSGDDAPGILGIGLVQDPEVLTARAIDSLAISLARQLGGARSPMPANTPPGKFRPKIVYRSEQLDAAGRYSIAVMPFFNRAERSHAGEIIALHMMRNLVAETNLAVVEPGIVRDELLRFRIIMEDGVSLADTDTILNAVNADLVLNGEVLEYRDVQGPVGAPRIDFSILFVERKSRKVVYSSYSHNAGNDGVFFFDVGLVKTAHAMAAHMARAVAQRMVPAKPRVVPE